MPHGSIERFLSGMRDAVSPRLDRIEHEAVRFIQEMLRECRRRVCIHGRVLA
jgi:hypothetical protein